MIINVGNQGCSFGLTKQLFECYFYMLASFVYLFHLSFVEVDLELNTFKRGPARNPIEVMDPCSRIPRTCGLSKSTSAEKMNFP